MTSTNNGRDVKSIQTSGQKAKKYYIDIYQTLEKKLAGQCTIEERILHVGEAWRLVHSLCSHSAEKTHPYLLAWVQRHTAHAILQDEWRLPENKKHHAKLEEAINDFVLECTNTAVSPLWEGPLLRRARWFKSIIPNPWGHAVLKALLHPEGEQPTDEEVIAWLREERGMMLVTRLRIMARAKQLIDLALVLASAIMGRVRRVTPVQSDADQADVAIVVLPEKNTKRLTFGEILSKEAGFTNDVWELLTDIEFVLLHKIDQATCIDLAKKIPLKNGKQIVERLQNRLDKTDKSPADKRLWKKAKDVSILIAQVVITRCMVVARCTGGVRVALEGCAGALAQLLPDTRLPQAAAAMAAPASSAAHLYIFADAIARQCKGERKPFVCELYVRAITAGMNELEKLKLEKEKEAEACKLKQTLSEWFSQLGDVLAGSARLRCECLLTAFSMHPTAVMYERVCALPPLAPLSSDSSHKPDTSELVEENNSEYGSWASDSCRRTNFVKTSETLNLKQTQKHTNILSSSIFDTECEALGLSALCEDLAVLLSGPRLKTLSWDMDREALLENCRMYMERTHQGTRTLTMELKYLNLDPRSFDHLPEEADDENDNYGIEKGYEQPLDYEDIWSDDIIDYAERCDSVCSVSSTDSAYTIPRQRNRKSNIKYSDQEKDPLLGLEIEIKDIVMEDGKKYVQNEIREMQSEGIKKKQKLKCHDNKGSKHLSESDKEKELQKKHKRRERKERKKQEKMLQEGQILAMGKQPPAGLSRIIDAAKKLNPDCNQEIERRRKDSIMRTQHVSFTDSDYDSQGKSSLASVNSERNDPDVLVDGLCSIDDIRSPQELTSNSMCKINEHIINYSTDTKNLQLRPVLDESYSKDHKQKQLLLQPDIRKNLRKLLQYRQQKRIIDQQKNCQETLKYNNNAVLTKPVSNINGSEALMSQTLKTGILGTPQTVENIKPIEIINKSVDSVKITTSKNIISSVKRDDTPSQKQFQAFLDKQTVMSSDLPISDPDQKQYQEFLKHKNIHVTPKTIKQVSINPLKINNTHKLKLYKQNSPVLCDLIEQNKKQCLTDNHQGQTVKGLPILNYSSFINKTLCTNSLQKTESSKLVQQTAPIVETKKQWKPQKRRVANGANTFSRLNIIHKNKQADKKTKEINDQAYKQRVPNTVTTNLSKSATYAAYEKINNLQTKGEIVISKALKLNNKSMYSTDPKIIVKHGSRLYPSTSANIQTEELPNLNVVNISKSVNEVTENKLKIQNDLRSIVPINLQHLIQQQSNLDTCNKWKGQYANTTIERKAPSVPISVCNVYKDDKEVMLGVTNKEAPKINCTPLQKGNKIIMSKSKPHSTKDNIKVPQQAQYGEKVDTEEWKSVMNALRALKTPNKGWDGQDISMGNDPAVIMNSKTINILEKCISSPTINTEIVNFKDHATKRHFKKPTVTNLLNEIQPKIDLKVTTKKASKYCASQYTQLSEEQTKLLTSKSSKTSYPIMTLMHNSDYDQLDDLIDDDLRQEIEESSPLNSEEDSYRSVAATTTMTKNEQFAESFSSTDSKSNICNVAANHTSIISRIPTAAKKQIQTYTISNNINNNNRNIIASPINIANPANIIFNQVQNDMFIGGTNNISCSNNSTAIIEQQYPFIPNVGNQGSYALTPTNLSIFNSTNFTTPIVNPIIIGNATTNITPKLTSIYSDSTKSTKNQCAVDETSKTNIKSDLEKAKKDEDIINKFHQDKCINEHLEPKDRSGFQSYISVRENKQNESNSIVTTSKNSNNISHASQIHNKSNMSQNVFIPQNICTDDLSEIDSKPCERKVLSLVQEKQLSLANELTENKKIFKIKHSLGAVPKKQTENEVERLQNKRLSIINRDINHYIKSEPIALTYAPIEHEKNNYNKQSVHIRCNKRDVIDKTELRLKLVNDNNNETTNLGNTSHQTSDTESIKNISCRRLRSSNTSRILKNSFNGDTQLCSEQSLNLNNSKVDPNKTTSKRNSEIDLSTDSSSTKIQKNKLHDIYNENIQPLPVAGNDKNENIIIQKRQEKIIDLKADKNTNNSTTIKSVSENQNIDTEIEIKQKNYNLSESPKSLPKTNFEVVNAVVINKDISKIRNVTEQNKQVSNQKSLTFRTSKIDDQSITHTKKREYSSSSPHSNQEIKLIDVKEVSTPDNDKSKKVLRLKLSNGNVFRVTVSGHLTVDIDTIISEPAIRALLLQNNSRVKSCTFSVKQRLQHTSNPKSPIIARTSVKDTVPAEAEAEVIDLISDDEDEMFYFETEFGKYRVNSIGSDTYVKHQTKFKEKCIVKMENCKILKNIAQMYENTRDNDNIISINKNCLDTSSQSIMHAMTQLNNCTNELECPDDNKPHNSEAINVIKNDLNIYQMSVSENNTLLESKECPMSSTKHDELLKTFPEVNKICTVNLVRCDYNSKNLNDFNGAMSAIVINDVPKDSNIYDTEEGCDDPLVRSHSLSILTDLMSSEDSLGPVSPSLIESFGQQLNKSDYNDLNKFYLLSLDQNSCNSDWMNTKPMLHNLETMQQDSRYLKLGYDFSVNCDYKYQDNTSTDCDSDIEITCHKEKNINEFICSHEQLFQVPALSNIALKFVISNDIIFESYEIGKHNKSNDSPTQQLKRKLNIPSYKDCKILKPSYDIQAHKKHNKMYDKSLPKRVANSQTVCEKVQTKNIYCTEQLAVDNEVPFDSDAIVEIDVDKNMNNSEYTLNRVNESIIESVPDITISLIDNETLSHTNILGTNCNTKQHAIDILDPCDAEALVEIDTGRNINDFGYSSNKVNATIIKSPPDSIQLHANEEAVIRTNLEDNICNTQQTVSDNIVSCDSQVLVRKNGNDFGNSLNITSTGIESTFDCTRLFANKKTLLCTNLEDNICNTEQVALNNSASIDSELSLEIDYSKQIAYNKTLNYIEEKISNTFQATIDNISCDSEAEVIIDIKDKNNFGFQLNNANCTTHTYTSNSHSVFEGNVSKTNTEFHYNPEALLQNINTNKNMNEFDSTLSIAFDEIEDEGDDRVRIRNDIVNGNNISNVSDTKKKCNIMLNINTDKPLPKSDSYKDEPGSKTTSVPSLHEFKELKCEDQTKADMSTNQSNISSVGPNSIFIRKSNEESDIYEEEIQVDTASNKNATTENNVIWIDCEKTQLIKQLSKIKMELLNKSDSIKDMSNSSKNDATESNMDINKLNSSKNENDITDFNVTNRKLLNESITLVYEGDANVALKGSLYEDPIIGSCYIFPLTNKNNTRDGLCNNICEKTVSMIKSFRKKTIDVDDAEQNSFLLKLPKVTYSRCGISQQKNQTLSGNKLNLKRKIDSNNDYKLEKRYRKGKNIDYPKKISKKTAYIGEYNRLLEYCTSVKFSYSRPFHKEALDIPSLLEKWPIKGKYCDDNNVLLKENAKHIFLDPTDQSKELFDPLQQTLVEEIASEYKDLDQDRNSQPDGQLEVSNFNMGFGEGSGRVIQDLENGNDTSKFSAATLSDVKLSQPFLTTEDKKCEISQSIYKSNKEELAFVKRYISFIEIRDKVRSLFRETAVELQTGSYTKDKCDSKILSFNKPKKISSFPYYLTSTKFYKPPPQETVVRVVQIGQLPLSASAQNPVTCDPRVTQVPNPSPSQSSDENSRDDDPQSSKAEYTELTTADLSLPRGHVYEQSRQILLSSQRDFNVPIDSKISMEFNCDPKVEIKSDDTGENNDLGKFNAKNINNVLYSYTPETDSYRSENYSYKPENDLYKPERDLYKAERDLYKPENELSKPENVLYKPVSDVYKPGKEVYKPEKDEYGTENDVIKPENGLYKSDDDVYGSKNEVHKPENEVYKPENELCIPDNDVYRPANDVNQLENDLYKPEVDSCKPEKHLPENVVNKTDNDLYKPEEDVHKPENTANLPENDVYQHENGVFKPENDLLKPKNDVNIPGNGLYKPGHDVHKPEQEVYRPENGVYKPQNDVYNIENDFSKPENPFCKPVNDMHKPETVLYQPDNDLHKPENDTCKPDNNIYKPEHDLYKLEDDSCKQDIDLHKPENVYQPDNDLYKPENDLHKTENILYQPENDTCEPDNVMRQPVNDLNKPENDTCQPENVIRQPVNDINKPENDTCEPENVTCPPVNDSNKPENELYKPENDRYQSKNDLYKPKNDLYKSENNKYKCENNKYKSENSFKYETNSYKSDLKSYKSKHKSYRSKKNSIKSENNHILDAETQNAIFDSLLKQDNTEYVPTPRSTNGTSVKTDQIAHAMNAAGITSSDTINNTSAEYPIPKMHQNTLTTTQASVNTYKKGTPITAMALQQALAQILPPPLNQTNSSENQNASVTPQVLHIVQGKNTPGNQITIVENQQNSVINSASNTPVLHIVQNKSTVSGSTSSNSNTATQHSNSFSGLSLVDAGLQQGGNQLLHIVNTGSQKNNSSGQLLKRVNLLTNLTNVQGSGANEQKMVQFVCKSADGKPIQLNAQHQRSMVLRLQPIESPNVPNAPKSEGQELSPTPNFVSNLSTKESNAQQQEIKSRSVYEENYAKFIQNSTTKPPIPEKSTSLPKFNQAFGKQVYQDQNTSEITSNNSSHLSNSNNSAENVECSPNDSALNLDHINQVNSPPLLLRKSPAQTSQSQQVQPNLVQQIKQTIAPMNIQTMHGGVIYTRQIPVNIGGGQTINLITVPSTDLMDETGQKQQGDIKFVNQNEMEPSIIKIVPQSQSNSSSEVASEENNTLGGSNDATHSNHPNHVQPVLTQMRIKLPMLSKNPQMVSGARLVRPSFFQIQRNMIGGANQPVYQQLVLTAAPSLGQQSIRPPQAQASRLVKPSTDSQASPESQMSTSTLEQLREFDMVLEQVKERSTVQPNSNSSNTFTKLQTPSADSTDGNTPVSVVTTEPTQQVLYSIGNSQALNVAYVNRKPPPPPEPAPTTSTFVRSPDSSGVADSSTSTPSTHGQMPSTSTTSSNETLNDTTPQQSQPKPKSSKSRSRHRSNSNLPNALKINTSAPKTSTQKPLEDEQTTQRILYILAEYKEQVENSPDKDKPAPRRRANPPSNPGSSKRKKSCSGSRRPCGSDMSPVHGEDTCRTMGSEDSSCGTSQGDCNENCLESHSPQDSPRKVVRKLTFENETTTTTNAIPRPQPARNVIVADGQTITVARGTAGKPATAVLMPANYILPVSMVKGGQQIAIVTNRGPKILTVGGEGGTNALLLQRLIGPGGLKPVLRPGIRTVRLPTAALHGLQAFNLATTTIVQPPHSTTPTPAPNPPDLVETRATGSPWPERETQDAKPDSGTSPESTEPWNLPSSAYPHDYSYEETVRSENMERTVLDAITDRYSPVLEAQRILDKMFDVDTKRSYILDSQDDSPRCGYDNDASDSDDKAYQQVVQKGHRQHRLAHVSAALRHKYSMIEHELRLQKSLSEECEDLGVDSPSAAELFPEAELLFAASPANDNSRHAHTPQPSVSHLSIPQPDIEDQIATDQLLAADHMPDDNMQQDLGVALGLDEGIVTVSEDGSQATITIDQEEFARSHPNTTFHSTDPTEEENVQPYTIAGLKGRHTTIFHAGRVPATVLMTTPQTTVISQAMPDHQHHPNIRYIDNIVSSGGHNNICLSSVLVKDDRLTRYDTVLNDTRELHLSAAGQPTAIVHSNAAQVIRRVCYEEDRRDTRFLLDETDALIAGDDAKMIAEDSSRDCTLESIADDRSSPERHADLYWESNSASERSDSRRPLDFSSDSDKCCKSPMYDELSTDSSGVGTHMRLDSVIKDARGLDRSGSADNSSADDTLPPLRTYPPKRMYHIDGDTERSVSGKTRAGERFPETYHGPGHEVRRRTSVRGVVKRGCHCCNGSPAPPRPKKSRQKKPSMDFTSN